MFDFSEDQEEALDAMLRWRAGGGGEFLTLGGYAGTGKTTLVSYLSGEWHDVAIVAFCGKAAHVLRQKGVEAQTAHSLVYVPFEIDGRVRFRKREHLENVRTVIVDEASMIDHVLYTDLLSFGIPVLFVGDHGQLEPIGTNPRLMLDPRLRLERIHRQAMDNPILRLAAAFREGRTVPLWTDPAGRLSVLGRGRFEDRISPEFQIICGFNKTRRRVNQRVRQMLGYKEVIEPGEKLICLQNNKEWNIFNGQHVTVLGVVHEGGGTIDLEIETDTGRVFTVPCLREQFGQDPIKDFWSQDVALMDYGYCLTAHKAQGSEWDDVLVLEELATIWDARRWRYTVATRAKKRLLYCA